MVTITRVVTIFLLNTILLFAFILSLGLIALLVVGKDPRESGLLIGISPLSVLIFGGIFLSIAFGILNGTAVNILWRHLIVAGHLSIPRVCLLSFFLAAFAGIAWSLSASENAGAYFLLIVTAIFSLVFSGGNILTILIAKSLLPPNSAP